MGLRAGGIRMTVFVDHIYYPKGTWLVTCEALGMDKRVLVATTAEEACAAALVLVEERMRALARDAWRLLALAGKDGGK